jgi:hypothetical protein
MSRLSSLVRKVLGVSKSPRPIGGLEFGMTVKSEQSFCRNYARDRYTGAGEIVDLGCWFGATTISFSRGLSRNPALAPERKKKRIHSYDLFVWHRSMEPNVKGSMFEGRFREGESFLPLFEERTRPWSAHFTVHPGDINAHPWNGAPIELLFVDAMKAPDTASSILRKFYPHVMPGVGLVAHQDFAHYYTGWIHLIQYRLRDYFEFDSEVKRSCTVVFRLKKEIPPARLEMDCAIEHASLDELNAAFDWSASIVSADKQEQIAAARAMAHVHRGEFDAAESVARDFLWKNVAGFRYHDQRPDLVDVREELERRRSGKT